MPDPARPSVLSRPAALTARVHLFTRRRRVGRWGLAIALGAAAAIWTSSLAADADRQRRQWSTSSTVWVVTGDVTAGDVIEPHDLEPRNLPAAALPEGALTVERSSPSGHRARVDLHPGEVLLGPRLTGDAPSEVTARLPADTRGVVIPAGETDPFVVGDRVDLYDLLDGRPLERDALVVAVEATTITVAVRSDRTGTVVASLAAGGVVAVLVP